MESKRLISLDAFRGFTIMAMILVNNPGSWSEIYGPLEHAAWNGLTPTDLIFPFFLFIVGVSIAFAYTKLLDSSTPLKAVYKKLVFRSVKIFAVGILLSLIPDFDFENLRYAGVLQRIAIVFLICGFMFLKTNWRTQLITAIVILVTYWLAMTLIPTPGYSSAILEPGKNLAAWIDLQLLPGKLWNETWDPEGLLSTLPSVSTATIGMLTGSFLLSKKTWEQKVNYMLVAGFMLTIIGYIWSWGFPLNKNIWSSSFVLVTSGLALMTLASLIFLVDVLGYKTWTTFGVVYGSNAIAIYVLSNLLGIVFYRINVGDTSLNQHFFNLLSSIGSTQKFASMMCAIVFVAINFIPAYILHQRKIFIKL